MAKYGCGDPKNLDDLEPSHRPVYCNCTQGYTKASAKFHFHDLMRWDLDLCDFKTRGNSSI